MDQIGEAPNVSIDDIELALSDLDMADAGEIEEIIETAPSEMVDITAADEAAIEAAVSQIELEEARSEIYEEAGEGGSMDVETHEVVAPEKPAKVAKVPRAPKAPKAAKTPRLSLDTLPPEAFVLTMADAAEGIDLVKVRDSVLAKRPAQKKVAEKFDNLLLSVAAGRAPSRFTMDCFRALKAAGSITSRELVAALEAAAKRDGSGSLHIGTARSQAGQMMSLFPALKIAVRDGQKITLNPVSVLADALSAML